MNDFPPNAPAGESQYRLMRGITRRFFISRHIAVISRSRLN